MGNTITVIVVIGLTVTLFFGIPLMTMSDRTDDIAQSTIKTVTTEFVDNVRTTGKLSMDKYDKFIANLSSTGNAYDVEMEIKVLDENPGKKTTQAQSTKIGENVYYSMYTSQILDTLDSKASNQEKILALKEGDIFSVSVKNTNKTISQQLKSVFYSMSGNDTYSIAAEHAGIVTANGTK